MTNIKSSTETDSPAYLAALAEIDQRRAALQALRPDFIQAEQIVARFPELNARVSFGANRIWIDVYGSSLAPVQPMLAAIVRSGFHPHGRHDYTDERAPRVTYDYGRSEVSCLIVNVTVATEGGKCRFERVGEKTVPILKIVCDDEVAA